MNNSKAMGLGSMLLFLILAIVFLPIVVRFIDKMEPHYVSGFEDMVKNVNVPSGDDSYRPDSNTNYLCRSPNEKGVPCEEGQFCDGSLQKCVPNYIGGTSNVGYFS